MQQLIGAIPAQCKRCGELFDLSYDLKNMDSDRLVVELMQSMRNPRMALCWDCRAK